MQDDRFTTGEFTSATLSMARGEGPELARLLRMRLTGMLLVTVLAILWCVFEGGNLLLVSIATGFSVAVTAGTILGMRGRYRDQVAEIHVASDVVAMPLLVLATGGHQSPFVAMLALKWLLGAFLITGRRAALYAVATQLVALATWLWPHRALVASGDFAAPALHGPLLVTFVVAILGAGILQAGSFPLNAYRNRRRELVQENRRLEEAIAELESQNRRLVALHHLARELGALGGLDEVAVRLRESVVRTFPGQAVSFFLFRRESGWLEPVLLPPGVDAQRVARIGAAGGVLAETFRLLETPSQGNGSTMLDPGSVQQVLVPLLLGEKRVGLMVLEDRVVSFFPEADRELLGTMASEMAVALRNAELHARTLELRDSMESLIQNANALILVVDAMGVVEVANRQLVELLGPALDPVGRPVAELFTPEAIDELGRALRVVRGGAPVENLSLGLKGRGGGVVRAAFNLAPVADRDGSFRAAIAVGQDITRMEMLERSIEQSEKLASIGQFVAGIAHEMNNPLTAITAYGEYLRGLLRRGGELPANTGEKIDQIVLAGERIQGFVQSLLGLARPTTGQRRPLDLNQVVRDAVRLCHYDLSNASVEVVSHLAEDLPAVDGTASELQQVFINLFVNASHAMPETGGALTIRTEPTETAVRVIVADTGSGMPPVVKARIFEPFYTTKSEGKGTGLGMSIVKKILDAHHATVGLESTPGQGTTFTLEFPRSQGAVVPAAAVRHGGR